MTRFALVNWLLLLAVAVLVTFPVVFVSGEYAGADGQAEEAITESHPNYVPWFSSIYEPPSGEIESGLFALQAAIGAGVIGYYFGAARTRRRLRDQAAPTTEPRPADDPS